ncbi:MAG: pilus assembly protein PilM [Candidatus Omnitrophica bacterium]|nr:pilus assembly protein PilM [Candidatus Omnitrophota bacterium]MDD5654616.1 pilus assembly protein PilM [Candidatus Omnitrophota bacterium]
MRSRVGLYFGTKGISVIESQGRKIVNQIHIATDKLGAGEFDDKVPEDVKIVALVRDELRKRKIEGSDMTVILPGKDLIIRSFEMPVLPKEELLSAINFEAKKYIPFRAEDLIFDFQLKFDRATRRNQILFFGIKKEILDKYMSVIGQLGMKLSTVEYSAFSLLRLSGAVGVKPKGVVGVTYVDLEEETNFMVLEDGFPLFSRDIDLTFGLRPEEIQSGLPVNTLLDKLKGEIRISLDYYRRKFPTKQLDKVILLANPVYKADIEKACQDLGAPMEFADAAKYFSKDIPYSMGEVKAYSASLLGTIKSSVNLDFLVAKEKALTTAETETGKDILFTPETVRVDPRSLILGVLIIAATIMFSSYQAVPLKKELDDTISRRVKVADLSPTAPLAELEITSSEYREKLSKLENALKQEVYLTPELSVIPALLPKGAWLVDFTFRQDQQGIELVLKGQAFLDDRDKEFEVINTLSANIKNSPVFSKAFSDINISFDRSKAGEYDVTNFTIFCKKEKNKQ